MTKKVRNLHIYFLLDRSGSMQSMADDVVGGFNGFLAAQQGEGHDAVLTLVQFDSQDSHEVLVDGSPIAEVEPLDRARFQPRGGTPLYDAIGHLIADATIRAEKTAIDGSRTEEILFVTFTDGMENRSTEYTQKQIFGLISKRQELGWTFAYLGANQDSYAEGGQIGYSVGNVQNFAADGTGTAAAFASLSPAVSRRRAAIRTGAAYDNRDLFEGDKGAELDLQKRAQRSGENP
ncbi:MAG: vWA domain-containing protein [Acidimicrobiales bacterium]